MGKYEDTLVYQVIKSRNRWESACCILACLLILILAIAAHAWSDRCDWCPDLCPQEIVRSEE